MDDESHLAEAFRLAAQGHAEGGCPIGGVLVDNDSGAVLGRGHNALVQEGNPIVHGEMAALRDAGRLPNRHRTTLLHDAAAVLHVRRDDRPVRHSAGRRRRRGQRGQRRDDPLHARQGRRGRA